MRALTVLLVVAALAAGCRGSSTEATDDTGPPANADVQRQLLSSLATEVFLSTYVEFEQAVAALEVAVAAWATSDAQADREAAQQAWIAAMDIWQRAELLDVGPQGDRETAEMGVAGGQDLGLEIYSWPTAVNPCQVDAKTADATYEDPEALAAAPANVRGLDALEYLLFVEGTDNACKPQSQLNVSGDWAAVIDQVPERRADYAAVLGTLLKGRAEALRKAWDPAEGNFVAQLSTAGDGSMTWSSAQAALNAISDALLYLDKATKDMKLGVPAGISGCSRDACPDDVESEHAQRSKEHILNNIRGFERVFLGGPAGEEGTGFDDLLRSVGADDLADTMTADLAAAITAVEAVDGTLVEAVVSDAATVAAAHEALRAVTTNLKTQFLGVLDLELPKRVASDND